MRTPDGKNTNFMAWLFSSSKRAQDEAPDEEPVAKKQRTDNVGTAIEEAAYKEVADKKVADKEVTKKPHVEASITSSDVLIIKNDNGITMFSDMLRKRPTSGATRFISEVQADGGRFIILQSGATVVLENPGEISHLVKQAHSDRIIDTPRKGKREIENLVVLEEEDEHPALNLTKEAIARTAPNFKIKVPNLGGTIFKPDTTSQRVTEFMTKASKLKQKSEDDLYSLAEELDDAEDAVHLYRNFCDEPKIVGRKAGQYNVVNFSRREIDLLVYSEIHKVEREYTWNLMPYRDRKSLFTKFKGTGSNRSFVEKIEELKGNGAYVNYLNNTIALLFEAGED